MVAPQTSVTREHIHGRSWSAWFFWWIMKLFLPVLKRKKIIAPRGPQTLDFPPPNLGACSAGQWEYKDWTMVELTPPRNKEDLRPRRIMMYLYGSGFQNPIHPRQWGFASYLAEKLDAETSVIPYPLPPLNNAKEVIPVLVDVYDGFVDRADGREVIVTADSAGAQVALCLLYAARSKHPLPHQLVLISPLLNTEMSNPAMNDLAPYDPALSPELCKFIGRLWAGGDPSLPVSPDDAANPTINAMAGDISLLKNSRTLSPGKTSVFANTGMRVVLVSAGYDVLHADTLVWLELAEAASLEVHYVEGVRQFHDFPTGRKIIWEGKVATDRVVEIVKARSIELGFSEPGSV